MKGMSSTDIVLIIGAFFTGICSVIAALKANKALKILNPIELNWMKFIRKLMEIWKLSRMKTITYVD
jgi:hypothetical protein